MKITRMNTEAQEEAISTGTITVLERIPLRKEYASVRGAWIAGQAYEDVAHENAHEASGHVAHAEFYFEPSSGGSGYGALVLLYPWASSRELMELLASEEEILADWFRKYAAGPRTITLLRKLRADS